MYEADFGQSRDTRVRPGKDPAELSGADTSEVGGEDK